MSNEILVRYVGFEAKARLREYTFLVKDGSDEPREFKLTIANEAFLAHRVRYQDAPDICAHRLQRELAASDNHPAHARCAISEAELEEYRVAHSPKPKSGLMYKPSREAY